MNESWPASTQLMGATKLASTSILQRLIISTNTELDVSLLEELRELLKPDCVVLSQGDDDCEQEWLAKAADTDPFPNSRPVDLFSTQTQLDQFTFYIFERRYGRTEVLINSTIDGNLDGVDHAQDISPRGQDDGRMLSRLNTLLDEQLRWLLSQPVNIELLKSLKYAVAQAHSLPVVRNHTCVHVMEWIKIKSAHGFSDQVFPLVKGLIVSGITDVWSAIRNSCVARLAYSLDHFTLEQAHIFYDQLIQICQAKESSWQAVEGAVMGMTTLVRRFSWSGDIDHQINNNSKEQIPQYTLKFGSSQLRCLPKFILDSVHSVLYTLLGHQQLSIRDQATNAFSSILSRCEFQEAFFAFQDVIQRLCKGVSDSPQSNGTAMPLPHVAVLRSDFKFLQAYQAEGLLGVCVFLIKHIPHGYLLTTWPLYFSTFNLYLMHPASTVRQATSAVFKYLVAKESSSPVLLKLVLQGLAAEWQVDTNILTSDLQNRVATSGDDSTRSPTPEARRGMSPVQMGAGQGSVRGTTPPDSTGDHQSGSQTSGHSSLHKQQRISVRNVQKLLDDHPSHSSSHIVSQTWEWREGRLLAYELILKFLIANHIHYVFPTFALSRSTASASASVDENLIRAWTDESLVELNMTSSHGDSLKPLPKLRRQSEISPTSHHLKSNSFAAISSNMSSVTPMTIQEDESVYIEAASNSCNERQNPSQIRDAWSRHAKRSSSFSNVDDDATRTRKLIRQYSVTCQKYPKRPFRPPKPQATMLANSLLCQASAAELEMDPTGKAPAVLCGPVSNIVKTLASPLGKMDQQNSEFHLYKDLRSKSKEQSDDVTPWVVQLELESLTCILSQILFQTIECLADSRWELRRMGQQLLPLVTETIRWFNMAPLNYLWDNHLTRENTLLCYGGCIALKNSLMHAGRLRYYLDQPPTTWKDPESCSRVAMYIVNEVKNGIKRWLLKVQSVVQYPGYDRLTVVAMETIMLAHIYFHTSLDLEKKLEAENQILDVVLSMFVCSFPDNPLCSALMPFCRGQSCEFLVPLDGFLSCSSRIESPDRNAQQFGKHFFSEAHVTFKSFLKTCQADKLVVIFPVLIHYVNWLSEETTLCHSLVDGLQHILAKTQEMINSTPHRDELDSMVQTYFDLALVAIGDVIKSTKVMDIAILRQLLDVTTKACDLMHQPTLSHIFRAISEKLDYDPDLLRLVTIDSASRTNTPDLYILNNDIPTSPLDEPAIPVEEEDEEHDSLGVLRESEALDASHGSGRGPVRQEDDESELSDWDSWEEEEEDQSALIAVFSDFLHNLQNMCEAKSNQESSVFKKQLRKCERLERQAIASVMQS